MGGLARVHISNERYEDVILPAIHVSTDFPAISTLAAQYAGWRISVGDYFAMGSGPARALSLKPKKLYRELEYEDKSEVGVLVLETSKEPTEEALEKIANDCKISTEGLRIIYAPTSSVAGSIQISGRIVETGIHKLHELGFDTSKIISGVGYAPIAPIHPKATKAMGRTNDAILYAGVTYYTVDMESDEELKSTVEKVPSSESKDYGKPFADIFKDAEYDFYKIDPNLFAPAKITINNTRTGKTFTAGAINIKVLKESFGLA
jgi:methenyltetrahydromethanopterin cyclohydrolase